MKPRAEEHWKAKGHLLGQIRDRINRDLEQPTLLGPGTIGMTFAPLLDLVARSFPEYGWVPQGIAGPGTPRDTLLRRGALMLMTGGSQEQCPGGPGENLLDFEVAAGGDGPSGHFSLPYDLRWGFGENLAEYVLVQASEPILDDPARLDALTADVVAIIAEAPPIALARY